MSFLHRTAALPALAGLALAFAAAPAAAADYVQAPGSALTFASQYQGEVFVGRFPDFRTTFSFDPAALDSARLDVVIPLGTASTRNPERDETLLGSDFFFASKFPEARFQATRFRALDDGRYAADGTLSLRGISKPVTLTFEWTPGAAPVLTGKATVPRLAFDVGGGDWSDVSDLPNAVAVSTRVVFSPAK